MTRASILATIQFDGRDHDIVEDGEVVGIDTDGCVVQWGSDCGLYNSGETLAEFGESNLRPHEAARIAEGRA